MFRVVRGRAVSFLKLQDCKEFNGIDPRGQRPDRLIGRKETESKEEETERVGGAKREAWGSGAEGYDWRQVDMKPL